MSEATSAIGAGSRRSFRSILLSPVMKEVDRRTVLCFGLASGTLSLLGRDANADDSAKRKRSTASGSSFPYSVPSSGQALLIGNNFAEDVRPPSHSAYQWNYSLFYSYGGGTFVEDYLSRRSLCHCRLRRPCPPSQLWRLPVRLCRCYLEAN